MQSKSNNKVINKVFFVLFLVFSHAGNVRADIVNQLDLGRSALSGWEYALAVSSDGRFVGGNHFLYDILTGQIINGTLFDDQQRDITGLDKNGSSAVFNNFGGSSNGSFSYTGGEPSLIDGTIYANAISADGSTIVGGRNFRWYQDQNLSGNFEPFNSDVAGQAFKYTSNGFFSIGALVNTGTNKSSYAQAVSSDGSIIVGKSHYDSNSTDVHAFKYTVTGDTTGNMVDLGTLGGNQSAAFGVSGDGTKIVGASNISSGGSIYHAFLHEGTGMRDLGLIDNNLTGNSIAYAISGDGRVIVGESVANSDGHMHAFKMVLNNSNPNMPNQSPEEMIDIGTLGGDNSRAFGVSQDGSIIVGEADDINGTPHAFIYRNYIINLENTYKTIYYDGARMNSIFNIKYSNLTTNMMQDCDQFGLNGICVGGGTRTTQVDTYKMREGAAHMTIAYKFKPKIRAGVTIDQTFVSDDPEGFRTTNPTPLVAVYGDFLQNSNGSGYKLRVAGAYNKSETNIRRSALLDTEIGAGDADIESFGLMADLSYKLSVSETMWAAPYIGIKHTKIVRDAYTENTGADFPISYKSTQASHTNGNVGFRYLVQLSPQHGLEFNTGLDFNLENRIDGYDGVIHSFGAVGIPDSFSLNAPNTTKFRPFIESGYYYRLSRTKKISAGAYHSKAILNNAAVTGIYTSYEQGF
ncbi:MAG: outer rane autotransporter barrel protein [Rickettsiaceae bacterium]|jgi:probable HAF family extracellular repeat protein|nr:outer rane autotransporter barrel protein [Rickettsiaceae bacterium]